MRRSTRRTIAGLILVLLAGLRPATPAHAAGEKESYLVTLGKAAGSSAAGKGAEFAVKLVGGLIYDSSCNVPVQSAASRYICDVLGSVTGKTDEAWKNQVKKQLADISKGVETLTLGQNQIANELRQVHKTMEAEFEQAAQKVQATQAITKIEGNWKKYQREFAENTQPNKAEMIELATKLIKDEKLDSVLQDLNVALTTRVLDGQPMLRFPFYKWRETRGFTHFRYDGLEAYDFAEKKFMEYRTLEDKAYLMYLWAATVIESKCQLEKAVDCKPRLPVSTAVFKRDFERYTKEQVEVFNAAADWLLLSYGNLHGLDARYTEPERFEEPMARANFLTASILAPGGKGMWGRVIAMGNAWDGTLRMQCGGKALTVKPVLSYTTPVEGNTRFYSGNNHDYGPADWWVARKGDAVYDEVHFANEWKIFHYSLPDAAVGDCAVTQQLPERGILPWVQPGTQVAQVTPADGRPRPFGSFLAIQRAGGTYALMSGGVWSSHQKNPAHLENPNYGDRRPTRGVVKYEVNNTLVESAGHAAGPWIGVLSAGRGEYNVKTVGAAGRIEVADKIKLYMTKPISFPEGAGAVLNLVLDTRCDSTARALCRTATDGNVLLGYDVENNDTEEKKGSLTAWAGVYLSPRTLGARDDAKGEGIDVDKSYEKKGSRERVEVSGSTFSGPVKTTPSESYYLNFALELYVSTEGRGFDATTWMYRGRITPGLLYLSKK